MAKKAIPQASRRAVAIANGGIPGETTVAFCVYCGAEGAIWWPRLSDGRPGAWVTFPGLELDHVEPEHTGGEGTPDNLVLACRSCNRKKGHRSSWRDASAR